MVKGFLSFLKENENSDEIDHIKQLLDDSLELGLISRAEHYSELKELIPLYAVSYGSQVDPKWIEKYLNFHYHTDGEDFDLIIDPAGFQSDLHAKQEVELAASGVENQLLTDIKTYIEDDLELYYKDLLFSGNVDRDERGNYVLNYIM